MRRAPAKCCATKARGLASWQGVLLKLLVVFGLGMVGLWEGIPAGFVMRLHPLVVGATAAAGSISATLLVLLLGERLRRRLMPKESRRRRDASA